MEDMAGYSEIQRDISGYSRIQRYMWDIAGYSGMTRDTAGCGGMQRDTAGYSGIQSDTIKIYPRALVKRKAKKPQNSRVSVGGFSLLLLLPKPSLSPASFRAGGGLATEPHDEPAQCAGRRRKGKVRKRASKAA